MFSVKHTAPERHCFTEGIRFKQEKGYESDLWKRSKMTESTVQITDYT